MSDKLVTEVYTSLEGLLPPAEYVVHNATDDVVTLTYDAETRKVPPFNEVVKQNKLYPDVPHSLLDESGEYVKGTLVIGDIHAQRSYAEGGTLMQWSAAACIQHCLGIDIRTGKAYGNLALKGVSFIPRSATKEQIARIAADGRARYAGWLEENSSAVVAAYEERNTARARIGEKPLPPDKHVRIATRVLEASMRRDDTKAQNTLNELEKIISDSIPAMPDEDAELHRIARELAQELKSDQALVGDSELLVQRLLHDPEAMKLMRSKFKMRKLREPREELPGADEGVDTSFISEPEEAAS